MNANHGAALRALLLFGVIIFPLLPRDGTVLAAPNHATSRWYVLLSAPVLRRPSGLAIDRRGDAKASKWAYTTDLSTGRVIKFGTGGHVLGSWRYGRPGGSGTSLAVGGSGNVFVAAAPAGIVSKFSPSGRLLARWVGFRDPAGIAVDPAGDVFVAEAGAQTVTERSPAGAILHRFGTAAGFLQLTTVPPAQSGDLGTPTGVAILAPNSIWISTTCMRPRVCRPHSGNELQPDRVDALLTLRFSGHFAGYLGDWWWGLGHAADGTPQEYPAKESEPFAAIQSLTSTRQGTAYLAGTLRAFTGGQGLGVIAYSQYGAKTGPWYLPTGTRVHGLAVDPRGAVYVVQGSKILVLRTGRRGAGFGNG